MSKKFVDLTNLKNNLEKFFTEVISPTFITKENAENVYAKKSIYDDASVSLGRKDDTSIGENSVAIGRSVTANADCSHAEGYDTKAGSEYQHVEGKYNVEDTEDKYAHIVGGGTSDENRKNIHTLDWKGNAEFAGNVAATDSNGNKTNLLETIHKVYSMDIGNFAVGPVVINDFKINPGYRYLYIINGSGTATYEVGILMFINGMKFVPLSSSSGTTMKDSVRAIGIDIYIENGQLKVSRNEISYGATCVIYKM